MTTVLNVILIAALTAIVLKLTGLIAVSWATVLAPLALWILLPGIVIACACWVLYEMFKK